MYYIDEGSGEPIVMLRQALGKNSLYRMVTL